MPFFVTSRPPSFGRALNKSAVTHPTLPTPRRSGRSSRCLSKPPAGLLALFASRRRIGAPMCHPYTDMAARIYPLWSIREELPCSDAP